MESVEEMAVRLKLSGYSDKIFEFAETYIDIMLGCAKQGGFEESLIWNSMEQCKAAHSNSNYEVSDHSTNNRLLFLLPHTFHEGLMAKVLSDKLKAGEEGLDPAFDPGLLLKEKILDNVSSVQVLIFGNTAETEATEFC